MSIARRCPALVISAPASGQGKTAVTGTLALRECHFGLVQPDETVDVDACLQRAGATRHCIDNATTIPIAFRPGAATKIRRLPESKRIAIARDAALSCRQSVPHAAPCRARGRK